MPGQRAEVDIVVHLDDSEINAVISRAEGRLAELTRLGATNPVVARRAITEEVGAPLQASIANLTPLAGSESAVARLNAAVDEAALAFLTIGKEPANLDKAILDFRLAADRAGVRLLAAAEKAQKASPEGIQATANDKVRQAADKRQAEALARQDPAVQATRVDAGVSLKAQDALEKAFIQLELETNAEYLRSMRLLTVSRRLQNQAVEAMVQGELAASGKYIEETAAAGLSRRRIGGQAGLVTEAGVGAIDDITAGELAAARRRRGVREGEVEETILAQDAGLAGATGQLKSARLLRAAKEREAAIAVAPQDISGQQRANLLARLEAQRVAIDPKSQAVGTEVPSVALVRQAELFDLQKRMTAASQSIGTQDKSTLLPSQRNPLEEAKNAERAAIEGNVATSRQRLALSEATLRNDQGLLTLKTEELVNQKLLRLEENKMLAATIKQAEASGLVSKGTLTQRLIGGLSNLGNNTNPRFTSENPTLGSLAGRSLVTTARFAASGALLFGGITAITQSIKAAEDLEKVFNQIEQQFKSLGKAGQFSGFRNEILSIARDTGSAGAEVAHVGFQLQGAFGGDTQKALSETRSAFEAVKVTGLSITEVIDAFTALTQSFKESNLTIAQISDTALGLQERFGVLAKETISFASDLAPVAAQAGFTAKQLETIGAVAQKYSGKSGSSLAEAFGRIIPSIPSNAQALYGAIAQLGDQNLTDKLGAGFKSGDTAQVFDVLLQTYQGLGKQQQEYILRLLGGRKETQALIPVLEHAGEVLAEFGRTQSDAGKTSQYFGDLQTTLAQNLSQLGEKFTQIGVKLFNGGLGQFLKDITGLLTTVVDLFSQLADVVGTVAGAFALVPGAGSGMQSLLEAGALYLGVKGLGGGLSGARAISATGGGGLAQVGGFGEGAFAASGLSRLPGFIKGIPGRYASGAAQGFAASAEAAGGAATGEGLGLAGLFGASASGFKSGLTAAFGSTAFVTVGLLVGALVANQIKSGVQEEATRRLAGYFGQNGERVTNPDAQRSALEKIGVPNANFDTLLKQSAEQAGSGGAGRSINDLTELLRHNATASESGVQQVLAAAENVPIIGGNFSADDATKQRIVDEFKKYTQAHAKDSIQSMLDDQNLLLQAARDEINNKDLYNVYGTGHNEATPGGGVKRVNGTPTDAQVKEEAAKLQTRFTDLQAKVDAGTASDVELGEFYKLLDQARGELAAKAVADGAKFLELLNNNDILAKFKSGDIGIAAAKKALDRNIQIARDTGQDSTNADPAIQHQFAQQLQQVRDFQSNTLLRQAKALADAADLSGGGAPQSSQTQLNLYINLLNSGKLNQADEDAATQGALTALKAVHQARLNAAHSAEAQAKILAEGTPVPETLRVELIDQYLRVFDVNFSTFIDNASGGVQQLADDITKTVAQLYAQGGITIQEAAKTAIAAKITELTAQKIFLEKSRDAVVTLSKLFGTGGDATGAFIDAQVAAINSEIASLSKPQDTTTLTPPPGFNTVGQDTAAANEKNYQIAIAVQKARFDYQKALIEGDPIAEADIAQQQAQYDLEIANASGDQAGQIAAQAAQVRAARTREQAVSAAAAAERDRILALQGDGPIDAARKAIEDANAAAALARGPEAQAKAAAEQIRAQRGLADAIADASNAQIELAQAVANNVGDAVEAARLGLELAQKKVADLIANHPDDPAGIARAQAAVIQAEQNLRQTQISEGESAIQTSLDLGRISKGQAISQLEALKSFAKTQKEIDQIDLEIKRLRDSLGQDFKFNIPSVLGLPTAYESRRVGQTGSSGSYQDNRVQSVTVVVSQPGATAEEIATAVSEAMGQPNRLGTYQRAY